MKAISLRTYLSVYAALLALVAATLLASRLNLHGLKLAFALAIASGKAFLIALYFMHLRQSRALMRIAALTGIFWLGILFVLAFGDYLTRGWN
jgi:cytochrome c oxidase subunit 4